MGTSGIFEILWNSGSAALGWEAFITGLAVLVVIFFVGILWGRLWNKSFGLGSLTCVVVSGIAAAFVAFFASGFVACEKLEKGLAFHREQALGELGRSPSLGSRILKQTFTELSANNAQAKLDPPASGGSEVALNDAAAAYTLARVSAEVAGKELGGLPPFSHGLVYSRRDASQSAAFVTSKVDWVSPQVVTANNPWTKLAIEDQVDSAFESASRQLRAPSEIFRRNMVVYGLVLVAVQLTLVAVFAVMDIKTD